MKKMTKKSLEELASLLPVLNEKQRSIFVGGGYASCVFNCFDYLDGSAHNADYYYQMTSGILGYVPDASGNVYTDDISTIGYFGGFDVNELSGSGSISLTRDGKTAYGQSVIMTFNVNGQGHAVVVNGVGCDKKGRPIMYYYDPTTGKYGSRTNGSWSALYTVGSCNDSGVYQ